MDLETLRHSASHIMADAVKRLYPKVKLGIGPSIEDGFYYDFDLEQSIIPDDLPKIEEKMRQIVKENSEFVRQEMTKNEAIELFRKFGEDYKIELIENINEPKVTVYRHGDFVDLCKGPHVARTGDIKAFKLLSIAGAYWHGIETNPMLQRIYGTAFGNKEDLDKFLELQEEAKKRDHRVLGRKLDLFSFNAQVGAGLVLYHPKGAILRTIIEDYIRREHIKRGYQLVISPHILNSDIWIQSGHYDYYKENMYIFEIEGKEFAVKPMNCPGHILVYKSYKRSYKELPLRFFELGSVYRHEKSGVLHGLLRVRGFTQDDAHIFCLREQAEEEIIKVIDFVSDTLKVFGFNEYSVELSTKPKKYIGTDRDWKEATAALENTLNRKKIPYEINEGDGAFYGPKIDIKLKDALGRQWQCATIQCDFALPERFALFYVDKDGKEKRPIMLHRVILGSIERFIGALIEHYGGNFPLWLAPVQVCIIPITKKQNDYAGKLKEIMEKGEIRVILDARDEKMQKKIRERELEKIPYLAIVGEREAGGDKVSVRSKAKGDLGQMGTKEFLHRLKEEIEKKN
ncbi:MAG: threonine--tRNA ligase [Omnitrophica bacterium RBG_13_46_9]|nr:MAG: threonine--tRNA ligase [Omnitrophica bacterium RBG_13_46_9]